MVVKTQKLSEGPMEEEKKEKTVERYKIYGAMLKMVDGTVIKENFQSPQIGSLIARWKGIQHTNLHMNYDKFRENVYPNESDLLGEIVETFYNYNHEKILINLLNISYIKYERNPSCWGETKDPNVIDWEDFLEK